MNGSGRAPQDMTPALFASRGLQQIPERGPLTINVPGAVDGWFEALERFGFIILLLMVSSGVLNTLFAPVMRLVLYLLEL